MKRGKKRMRCPTSHFDQHFEEQYFSLPLSRNTKFSDLTRLLLPFLFFSIACVGAYWHQRPNSYLDSPNSNWREGREGFLREEEEGEGEWLPKQLGRRGGDGWVETNPSITITRFLATESGEGGKIRLLVAGWLGCTSPPPSLFCVSQSARFYPSCPW